ncbi:hypothetical protein KCTC52924_03348 [Arenibacter antarcticus]|uniref:Four helix bundle protein n=1 Tax=Arenibacter antarcticus TaxID=2040469 RepID=A0ABW5VFR6_9FLAO|nr:four helix bundle protein [Arenibacter sp. H213]MCM4166415.1 four helix bundle protein [Arenibacter sp. H213]
MHRFEELIIWQKAMNITEEVYLLSAEFPKEEKFGLKSQIRRSAVSIASNIAEGAGRNTNGEFRNFLSMASGSSDELYTQLLLAYRLKLVQQERVKNILTNVKEVQKMNYALIKSLKQQ